jgi:recombination protein RecA
MMHSNGISFEGDVLDLAAEKRIVVRSGAWFRYGDTQLGQGKEKARQFLVENPEVTGQITQQLLQVQGVRSVPPSAAEDSEAD